MRVAFFGNVCNNQYQVCRALREHHGIDAHLYINDADHTQMLPESDSPELAGNYPPWIHRGRYIHGKALLFPRKAEITKELCRYDAVVVSYLGPIFAGQSGVPTAFFVSGADLTVIPFASKHAAMFKGLARLPKIITSLRQNQGVRNMDVVWRMEPFHDHELEQLGLKERTSSQFFPLIIDPLQFRAPDEPDPAVTGILSDLRERWKFILFHPTRIIIRATDAMKKKKYWKCNDMLLEGFAKFVHESGVKDAVLVMPERSASPDIPLAKQMIHDLDIEDNIYWAQPPRPEGFTRSELLGIYAESDAVADQFGPSMISMTGVEALCMGKPLITHIVEEKIAQMYESHPVLNSDSADRIAENLTMLYRDPAERDRVGRESLEWLDLHHSPIHGGAIWAEGIRGLAPGIA